MNFLIALLKALGLAMFDESPCTLSATEIFSFPGCACKESDSNREIYKTICLTMRFFVAVMNVFGFTNVLPFVDLY